MDATDLPPEMLQMIFSFCSVSDLLESLQYVCKKWQAAVYSPFVWKSKTLEISSGVDLDYLKALLCDLPFLKSVSLEDVTSEVISVVCSNSLSLKSVQLYDFHPETFLNLSFEFTCLTKLDISLHNSASLEEDLEESIPVFPPLLSTCIFRNCTTSGAGACSLLQSCQFLEHLVVAAGHEVEEMVKSFLKQTESVKKTPGPHNVKTIYLCGPFLCNKNILHSISQCRNLRCLALKYNMFDPDQVLETLFKESQPSVVFLDLSYSFRLPTIVLISLVKACPNLEFLSLMRSEADNDILEVIMDNLVKLQCLNLHGTPITSEFFLSIPEKLPNLTHLNLCACRRIDTRTLIKLIKLMPNLFISLPKKGGLKGVNTNGRPYPFLKVRNDLDNLDGRLAHLRHYFM